MNVVRKVLMVVIITVFLIIGSPIEPVINSKKIKYSVPKPAMPIKTSSPADMKIGSYSYEYVSSGDMIYITVG